MNISATKDEYSHKEGIINNLTFLQVRSNKRATNFMRNMVFRIVWIWALLIRDCGSSVVCRKARMLKAIINNE